ncbi:hypothetical protein [Nocardia sp. NPDC059691]|uniref:hypothetical protein n=1 Tax=Nocardia sp. NPDC059691 TaxID=3346908 RepID=UPI0036C6CA5F
MTEDLRIEVTPDVSGMGLALRALLEQLDQRHKLRDSSFLRSAHRVSAPMLHLVAIRRGEPVGWLAGNASTGHIALVGVLQTRQHVGSALVSEFAARARRAGAGELTVTLDTEPVGRWDRRRFFLRQGFIPVGHSALHFALPLDNASPRGQRFAAPASTTGCVARCFTVARSRTNHRDRSLMSSSTAMATRTPLRTIGMDIWDLSTTPTNADATTASVRPTAPTVAGRR